MAIVRPKKKKIGDILTEVFLTICMVIIIIMCIYPFWHAVMYSLSDSKAAMSGGIFLLPRKFTLKSYEVILQSKDLFRALFVTLMKTVLGTGLTLVVTTLTAYPLSVEELRGKRIVMFYIYFTMLFGGGTIPTYILLNDLKLLNTFWVYVIPAAMSAYNMFILRNFFAGVPRSLPESAKLDGANPMQILLHITLPLSKPMLATISLYSVNGFWNSYMDGVLYVHSNKLQLLQVFLRNMINGAAATVNMGGGSFQMGVTDESLRMAVITFNVVPVVLVYLFLQKFFKKGINAGAVKG